MRNTTLIIFSALLASCGTRLEIHKSELQSINANFTGTYNNLPYKSEGKNQSFLLLLNQAENTQILSLTFTNDKHLSVKYEDTNGPHEQVLKGKFKANKFYEIDLKKKKIEIPPLIPILYSKYDIDRVRIAVLKNGDLVIDKFWKRGGNIFILGGGGNGRNQNYFRPGG